MNQENLLIRNAEVFGENGLFERRDVLVKNRRIAAVSPVGGFCGGQCFDDHFSGGASGGGRFPDDNLSGGASGGGRFPDDNLSGGASGGGRFPDDNFPGGASSADGVPVLDASGLRMIPGLVDIHSHGAFGHDFSDADAEGLETVLRYERDHGITTYCPTSMTLPRERIKEIFRTAAAVPQEPSLASIGGINMEGPFLDPAKKGAHMEKYIAPPDIAFFRECNEAAGGLVKLVTLAPNMPPAMEFIRELRDEVCISIGPTGADYETARSAMEAGARHVTHCFNALPAFSHREPGVVGAAADTDGCVIELISDGIHIHPSMIRAAFAIFGPERVALISDSMRAAGMENGTYELGGQTVTMKDCKATLADGTIAGSATNLYDCLRHAIDFGIPERDAILSATATPAKSIGIYGETGSITPGKRADLLLINRNWELIRVI